MAHVGVKACYSLFLNAVQVFGPAQAGAGDTSLLNIGIILPGWSLAGDQWDAQQTYDQQPGEPPVGRTRSGHFP